MPLPRRGLWTGGEAGEVEIVNRRAFYAVLAVRHAARVAVSADSPPIRARDAGGVSLDRFMALAYRALSDGSRLPARQERAIRYDTPVESRERRCVL